MLTFYWPIAVVMLLGVGVTSAIVGLIAGQIQGYERGAREVTATLDTVRAENSTLTGAVENLRLARAENLRISAQLAEARVQRDKLNRENDDLHEKLLNQRDSITRYQQESEHFMAQNAALNDALQEARTDIKALEMRTIELPSPIPARPRRVTRLPKGGA